ncbi:MAG: hypothetical protein RLZ83_671 [Pseudomonadota bacterium]|jgi:3-hydroxyisobutyrate dehydrogenase-like beta-hydroxyacid dehydrogenase
MKVGMVGIGMMGHGMAARLVHHGHDLVVLEHPGNQPLDALKAAGVRSVQRPCDLAAVVDVVILVVTGSAQVESVLTGPDGILQGLRPGGVVVDCSTSIPSSTARMAQAVEDAGSRFLEAPMTRTPKEAAEGRLNLLVGGDAQVLERVRPLLACLAEHITHVGPTGAGHGMKLLHNYVSLGMVTLLAEAAACAARSGMKPEVFVDVLARGGGGGTALERLKPYLLTGDPGGLRFTLANACKDLGYYGQMAQDAQASHAVADAVRSTLQSALDRAGGHTLVPELAGLLTRAGA